MSDTTSSNSDGVKVYLRLLGYVKKYLKGFIVGIIAMIIFSSTDAAFIALLKPLLDEKRFSLADVAKAHECLTSQQTIANGGGRNLI